MIRGGDARSCAWLRRRRRLDLAMSRRESPGSRAVENWSRTGGRDSRRRPSAELVEPACAGDARTSGKRASAVVANRPHPSSKATKLRFIGDSPMSAAHGCAAAMPGRTARPGAQASNGDDKTADRLQSCGTPDRSAVARSAPSAIARARAARRRDARRANARALVRRLRSARDGDRFRFPRRGRRRGESHWGGERSASTAGRQDGSGHLERSPCRRFLHIQGVAGDLAFQLFDFV